MALVAGGILTLVAISAVVGLLMAIPVYFLWNWLMPTVFGLTTITYWQAWGLYFLSAILLKSTPSSSRRS